MLDTEKPLETASPTLFSEAQITNDDAGKENPAEQTSVFEKIRGAASGLFERHGVKFKSGRGRPRKDGSPKISDVPINAPPTALPAGVAPVPPVDAPAFDSALVKRCVSAVVKALRGFLDKKLWRKACDATGDAKFASDLIKETTITEDELNGFSELTEICLKKYGVGTQYAPEIGLVAIVAGVGVRYAVALQSLEAKLAEKSQQRQAA